MRGGSTECNGTATMRMNTETLPWHVRYESFAGTLPSIASVRVQIVGLTLTFDPTGIFPNCRLRSEASHPFVGSFLIAGGVASRFAADSTRKIPLVSEAFCGFAAESDFRGTAEVFLQGSTTTRITVTLVQ